MMYSIQQTKSGAPGSTKYKPCINLKMFSQLLNVLNHCWSIIIFKFSMRSRFSTASLIKYHNVVLLRIEVTPVIWNTSTSRTSMKYNNRVSIRYSSHLPVQGVQVTHLQHSSLSCLDFRIDNIIKFLTHYR